MIDFSKITSINIHNRGNVVEVKDRNGNVIWNAVSMRYVSLGDSIAAGHSIDSDWTTDYGTGSQYGENGNTSTTIVKNSYTDLIKNKLSVKYGSSKVSARSFAHSGDKVSDLIVKLDQTVVKNALAKADIVTICIGANTILGEVNADVLNSYIENGNPTLVALGSTIQGNLNMIANNSNANSYKALFDKLNAINPNAKYVFTTIYHPYKYLYIEDGANGFFKPVLDTIPNMTIGPIDISSYIKSNLLATPAVQTLFSRVNAIANWAEPYINSLNEIIKGKIVEYQATNPNFKFADTKALYDTFPDRPITAPKHYNDLVNVEYTKGYNTMTMDWGRLWGDSATDFWVQLIGKHANTNYDEGYGVPNMAVDLVSQMIEKVIVPDLDPHPEEYGQKALYRSFADTLNLENLTRYTVSYATATGGIGDMLSKTLVTFDGLTAYTNIDNLGFIPSEGYYFTGWKDGNGNSRSANELIGINSDTTLTAQWSNLYNVRYRHTNHTNLFGENETGHMECYALAINGELKPKFGAFAEGSDTTYRIPYNSKIEVAVNDYKQNDITYNDKDCGIYWNGAGVAVGQPAYYTWQLKADVDIDFRWKIAGSVVTLDAQSWEDCYITTTQAKPN